MIHVLQGDITKVTGFGAIVNPANNSLLGGGGLDGMIHRAAGPQLKTECRRLNGCETGDSKLTLGYNLPCDFIIHSVGPVWMGGTAGEEELLSSCYVSALKIALENGIRKIAFPSISTGEYGYPVDKAAKLAIATVSDFVAENPDAFDDISFVVPDDLSFNTYSEAAKEAAPKKSEPKKKAEPKKKSAKKAKEKVADIEPGSEDGANETGNTDEAAENEAVETTSMSEVPGIELPVPTVSPSLPGAPYNKYHIDWLIDEVANGNDHTYVCFFLAEKTSEYCQLSQWYKGKTIYINGRKYSSAEQYMMSEKALLFNDFDTYSKIMSEEDPAICKKLGREISNFDEAVWRSCNREIIFNGNIGKFLSDKDFADVLLSTGDAVLIEASPTDDIYGAGLSKEELLSESGELLIPPQNWHKEESDFQAKNELGFVLMAVRDWFKDR
ncbi:conserved hypothetical protein, ribA/ribD-fused [Butyrivibrio sp. INlla16]|nr:macro domain-containing protein [Butyrivibrio sp. INlla16]SDB02942.1 conserved hypothetical protein, ribA/ribD-fused [Butyrivibrio sp. INlla16]